MAKKTKEKISRRQFCARNPVSDYKEFYLKKVYGGSPATEQEWSKRVK